MNQWLLANLQRGPDQKFYEWELRMYCGEFEDLRDSGLLVRDLEAEQSEFCFDRWGRRLQLVRMEGAVYGIDAEDPDEPITEMDPRELVRYRFNHHRWQQMIREANGLQGATSRPERHLFFLGEKVDNGRSLGFVLGFFNQRELALNLLLGLPARIASRYDAIVVTTPVSTPLPQQDIANLERLGVYVVPPLNHQTLMIECPRLARKRWNVDSVALSRAQETDYYRYEYKCRLPVHLTGRITKAGNNEVLVGDTPVELGDVPFLLFLRLVVELQHNKSGIVSKVELRSEGYFGMGTDDQSINRLRNCFVRALGGLEPRDFIETTYRQKMVRLSVHPDLVTWDAEKLSAHDDSRVRDLMGQLLQTAKRKFVTAPGGEERG